MKLQRYAFVSAIFLITILVYSDASPKTIKVKNGVGKLPNFKIQKIVIMRTKQRNLTRIRIKNCCGYSKCNKSTAALLTDSPLKPSETLIAPILTKTTTAESTVASQPSIPDEIYPEPEQTNTMSETPDPLTTSDSFSNDLIPTASSTVFEITIATPKATVSEFKSNKSPLLDPTSPGATNANVPSVTKLPTNIGKIASDAATSSAPLITTALSTNGLTMGSSTIAAAPTTPAATTIATKGATAAAGTTTTAAATTAGSATSAARAPTTTVAGATTTTGAATTTADAATTTAGAATSAETGATTAAGAATTTANAATTTANAATTTAGATTTTTTATTTTALLTTTAGNKPLCPPYNCSSAVSSLGSDGRVKDTSVINGTLKISGDRQYMFSSMEKTWTDAASACCSLGMKLLSLETKDEYAAISKIVDFNNALIGEYFTSGSDNKVEGSFVWCSLNNVSITTPLWGAGKLNDSTGTENCVTLTVSATNATIGDRSCTTPMKYICEVLYRIIFDGMFNYITQLSKDSGHAESCPLYLPS
ncbi:Hypothetical predicted protein [Cloeon dipterum]|uniref:C-type lectin domain-containing protein n=1 Tax=Cloeon dipterum TaxID=197152 RepID=A0A8S1BUU3_9INSE|nr:Hypothetical predicted protein [Cloeon dipterum]